MMTYLRNKIGTPATSGFIPKGLSGFSCDNSGYYYDPYKAKELLNRLKALYPGDMIEATLTTTSDYLDLCEFIQHEIAQIGIKMNIEVSIGATFREMVATSKLPFFRGSWIADYPDAENYLALFYSKKFSPDGPNYTHFSDKKYDELYEKALNEVNENKRFLIYQKMDSIIIEEAPVVFLFYDQVIRFTHSNIHGLETNPINLLTLKKVKKD